VESLGRDKNFAEISSSKLLLFFLLMYTLLFRALGSSKALTQTWAASSRDTGDILSFAYEKNRKKCKSAKIRR
jgi:hypothetical protein